MKKGLISSGKSLLPPCLKARISCLVPATGLEPARLAAYAPKAYVYTNFTTRAWTNYTTSVPGIPYNLPDKIRQARQILGILDITKPPICLGLGPL